MARCYLSCTSGDLADIAAQYNLTLHAFADDNQLYIACANPILFRISGFSDILKVKSGYPDIYPDINNILLLHAVCTHRLVFVGYKHLAVLCLMSDNRYLLN